MRKVRKPCDPHQRFTTPGGGESRTHQSFKDQCNINNIVKSYVRTGVAPGNSRKGEFLDCSNVTNFTDAMNAVLDARKSWLNVPAKVRDAFDDDPEALLDALRDPERRSELEELGILPSEQKVPLDRSPEPSQGDPASLPRSPDPGPGEPESAPLSTPK